MNKSIDNKEVEQDAEQELKQPHQDEIEGLHTKLEDPFEKLMKLRQELEEMD